MTLGLLSAIAVSTFGSFEVGDGEVEVGFDVLGVAILATSRREAARRRS